MNEQAESGLAKNNLSYFMEQQTGLTISAPSLKAFSHENLQMSDQSALSHDPMIALVSGVLLFFLKGREENESFTDEKLGVTLKKINLAKLTSLDFTSILRKSTKLSFIKF